MKISGKHFEKLVFSSARELLGTLPDELRVPAQGVIFEVRDNPRPDQDADDDYDLLGLYEGVPLPERDGGSPPETPDVITLFRHPLADSCESLHELKREIRMTIIHELGHFFGFSEEELEARGLG